LGKAQTERLEQIPRVLQLAAEGVLLVLLVQMAQLAMPLVLA
jgi:hypothetical protein